MPELLTKYPHIVLKVFKDAKITCGEKTTPKILVNCPQERFCNLPTGELCIYGLDDIPSMTQIHEFDFFYFPQFYIPFFAIMIMVFLIGVVLGRKR